MPNAAKLAKKGKYFEKLISSFDEYKNCLIVGVDNVGSRSLMDFRYMFREHSAFLMGKNTMMRKAINDNKETHPELQTVLPYLKGNVGFIFTTMDLKELRDLISTHKVEAAARAGSIAQCTVVVPAGPTGMEPQMTNFFQTLNIQTKIVKAQIEILNDVTLFVKGDKVGSSEVALLDKLNMKPFTYGIEFHGIYQEGSVFPADVLDIGEAELLARFREGIDAIAALSLATDYPTQAAMPHYVANGFKEIMHLSLGSDYTIKEVAKIKALLDDPEALAAAAAAAAAPAAGGAAPAAADTKAAEPEAEEEEEEADFDLFD